MMNRRKLQGLEGVEGFSLRVDNKCSPSILSVLWCSRLLRRPSISEISRNLTTARSRKCMDSKNSRSIHHRNISP